MNLTSLARGVALGWVAFALGCASPGPAVTLQTAASTQPTSQPSNNTNPPMVATNGHGALGMIQRLSPALDELIAPGAEIQVLVDGLQWAEGPVWSHGGLYFSDVPQNVIYRWEPQGGVRPFLRPSGYTGKTPRGGEPGSNGLTLDLQGRLTICQHGDRRVVRMEKSGELTPLAETFGGKRFSSPNDLCFNSRGDLYFTDPPYGLEGRDADPKKEMETNGVYLRHSDGALVRLPIDVKFPNGVALSPDERTLYICVSDPHDPVIMSYDVGADGNVSNAKVLFDASGLAAQGLPGLPDGMKIDTRGNVWSTGPGGVLVLTADGKHLGTIATGVPTANCAWGDDGSTLYIAANHTLCRVRTRAKGILPPSAGRK